MSESPTYQFARLARVKRAELDVRWAERDVAAAASLSPAKRAAATRAYNKAWSAYERLVVDYRAHQADHPQFPQFA